MAGSPAPYLWMLSGALAFSCMGAAAHALADDCDWQVIAIARTGLSLMFSLLLARAAGVRLVLWRPATLWWRSLAGSVSLVGTFFALTRLPVADVLTLGNLFPLWVTLLSWPLAGEAPTRAVWMAVACGISGVVLLEQPHLDQSNPAVFVALGCSFSTALAMLGLHRLQNVDARAIMVHFSAVALLFAIAALWVFDSRPLKVAEWPAPVSWLLLAVGLFATIGQLALTKAFTLGPAAPVSVVGLTQVGFGILFDVVWWQRTLTMPIVVGMALVTAPAAWLLVRRGWAQADDL